MKALSHHGIPPALHLLFEGGLFLNSIVHPVGLIDTILKQIVGAQTEAPTFKSKIKNVFCKHASI